MWIAIVIEPTFNEEKFIHIDYPWVTGVNALKNLKKFSDLHTQRVYKKSDG